MERLFTLFLIVSLCVVPLAARDASISGDYMEVRTADVYVGACFANGEVNLNGKEGMLAWRVRSGQWNGVNLEGLGVVAVVRTDVTLGDRHAKPADLRSILVVDEKATPEQQQALISFAENAAGELLGQVVALHRSPIQMDIRMHLMGVHSHGEASLKAGDLLELETRGIHKGEYLCGGNEEIFYPPLTEVVQAAPAVTVVHQFHGQDLGKTWSSPGKRSAFVGTFAY